MIKWYINHWKHLFFYVLRTSTLDPSTRDRLYEIQFTDNQLTIIHQLLEILDECDEDDRNGHQFDREDEHDHDHDIDEEEEEEDDFHLYDPDEDDGEYESTDEHGLDEEVMDDDVSDMYSSLLTRVAEKLMELSIAFITQHFPFGDDLRSPLTHFTDVMGISNRHHRFLEPYNYTSYVCRYK